MKIKEIMSIVAVALMAVGCSSDDGLQSREGRVPITLSASVGTEVTTRGVQETALASGETVYVWGKEGSGNYDYLQAWTLTAGADGALSGSAKYYPLSGETLTMVALHGNFSYTEGDALPASISHSVELDQSSTGNYEKSDLLWATVSGSSADATGKNLAFTHKLSKIEIKLHPGEGYSDISSADVKLRGVLPTITINPTDGTLGSASGSATLITPRLTVDNLSDATTPYALYEAIIPPQAAPVDFLNIKIGDKIATVSADVASFASNKRYVYDITITQVGITVTNTVTGWGEGATNSASADLRRPTLPIEYIAKYNMQTATTMAPDANVNNSAYFYWGANTTTPTDNIKAFINGTAVPGYHLPSKAEWCSVLAPAHAQYGDDTDPSMGGDTGVRISYRRGSLSMNLSETIAWGVLNGNSTSTYSADNYSYAVNQVFYNDYNCPDDDAHQYIGYGLRFKEKNGENYFNGLYTCAYRYEYKEIDATVGGGASLTVQVIYVGSNQNITIETISNESWWVAPEYTVVLPACGRAEGVNAGDHPAGWWASASFNTKGYYWSATARSGEERIFNGLFGERSVSGNSWHALNYGFPVRLFKDAYYAGNNLTTDDVGKVLGADGQVYATVNAAQLAGTTASGIIAYVGDRGSVETGTIYNSLVIALADGNYSGKKWYTTDDDLFCVSSDDYAASLDYLNGLACTNTLVNSNGLGVTANCVGHTHEIPSAARNYGTIRPPGASLWFLPSMGQWQLIVQGLASKKAGSTITTRLTHTTTNDTYKPSNLNSVITGAGGTGFANTDYWSCTQHINGGAPISYYSTLGRISALAKTRTEFPFRAVFAY